MGVTSMLWSKHFLIVSLLILVTVIAMWLISMPTPTIHTLMYETHRHISSLKNMNVMSSSKSHSPEIDMDQTYLELLGFKGSPRLYADDGRLPIVVSAVTNDNYEEAFNLLISVRKYLQDRQVLFFDIGLGSYELVELQKQCNDTTSCTVKPFEFDKFPRHVSNKNTKAYKAIAVQQALNEYGCIIWTSTDEYLVTSEVADVMSRATSVGIVAWKQQDHQPTSALTHPKMFRYFSVEPSNYYFHSMVGTDHLVIYNTPFIHEKVMLPWVQCSLNLDCMWPRGAQASGCIQRKPKYFYAGCHHFESSAINVILGKVFSVSYPYQSEQVIFGTEPEIEDKNITSLTMKYSWKFVHPNSNLTHNNTSLILSPTEN